MTSILREVDEVRRLELHHTREPPLPGHACFDERDITSSLRLLADDLRLVRELGLTHNHLERMCSSSESLV
jgi:hypothetical protein